MAHDPRQDEDGNFRKTFASIAVVHLVVLGSLLLATFYQPKQGNDSVVWMSPGSFSGDSAAAQAALTGSRESSPPTDGESEQLSEQEPDQPAPPSPPPAAPSPLLTPQPAVEESALPATSPTATPTPRSTPTAKPIAKATLKPTPKLTPKPSPAHSATPKPSPKSPVPAKEKEKEKRKNDDSPKQRASPVKSEVKEKGDASPAPSARQTESAQGKLTHDQKTTGRGLPSRPGSGSGVGEGKAAGTGNSALGAYVGVLTNRFQAAWNQPTSEMTLGKTLAVTVKLKVEADGTVTEFVIVEGSGNAVVDDSVREAGKKITKLPPPPGGQAFSAPVRFELGN